MSLRRDLLFFRENRIPIDSSDLVNASSIRNIIIETDRTDLKWIEESTKSIGEWRNTAVSCYVRWALSINGLHIAADKYSDLDWQRSKAFVVTGLVMDKGRPERGIIAKLEGKKAAEAHLETVRMLASYGLIDLCSVLEEMLLWFYRIYKEYNPEEFIKGPDNQALRKLFRNRDNDPDAWYTAWKKRLDKWQRNKLYDGLAGILLSYYTVSGLKKPSWYEETSPETWAEALSGIAILRNCLIHGTKTVPKELADISGKPFSLEFPFVEGEPIELDTRHLEAVELFIEKLLDAINDSLIEYHMAALAIDDSSKK
ncbi:MAG: hypothetical protein EOO61_09635 [Hymenobacter sp.]|nr:MAG: hypothetical protein EOO61_09635 [Hymenobacter sp.]